MTTARDIRGEYEEKYDNEIISDDCIETIVMNYEQDAQWTGCDPLEVLDESRKLQSTLEWSTIYNVLNNEEF